MHQAARNLLLIGLATLAMAQDPARKPADPPGAAKGKAVAGRIVDGLGRPVPGVTLTLKRITPGQETPPLAVVSSGPDGRFSCPIPEDADDLWLDLGKDGYETRSISADSPLDRDVNLDRKADWGAAGSLPVLEGRKQDAVMRELLASDAGSRGDREVMTFLFEHHEALRPCFRRLVGDAHVGAAARFWLDRLGDPGDRDLFPNGRKFAPEHEIRETDLVEAIRAIARKLNFFSSDPEPRIDVAFVAFTPKLDRALVQCGINMGPFTGVLWRFVFVKDGTKWVLRSTEEAGRG